MLKFFINTFENSNLVSSLTHEQFFPRVTNESHLCEDQVKVTLPAGEPRKSPPPSLDRNSPAMSYTSPLPDFSLSRDLLFVQAGGIRTWGKRLKLL
jgi:hypothetical protein